MTAPRPVHEHEFEPQHGLPERLPAGEHLLWQGTPDWRVIARRVFHVNKVAAYFALMLGWRFAVTLNDAPGWSVRSFHCMPPVKSNGPAGAPALLSVVSSVSLSSPPMPSPVL